MLSDSPNVKLGFRKIIAGALSAGATWAFTQYVPGFEQLPAEVTAAIPAVFGTIVFYFVPEDVERVYGQAADTDDPR